MSARLVANRKGGRAFEDLPALGICMRVRNTRFLSAVLIQNKYTIIILILFLDVV
jgi:hypothetical protein